MLLPSHLVTQDSARDPLFKCYLKGSEIVFPCQLAGIYPSASPAGKPQFKPGEICQEMRSSSALSLLSLRELVTSRRLSVSLSLFSNRDVQGRATLQPNPSFTPKSKNYFFRSEAILLQAFFLHSNVEEVFQWLCLVHTRSHYVLPMASRQTQQLLVHHRGHLLFSAGFLTVCMMLPHKSTYMQQQEQTFWHTYGFRVHAARTLSSSTVFLRGMEVSHICTRPCASFHAPSCVSICTLYLSPDRLNPF